MCGGGVLFALATGPCNIMFCFLQGFSPLELVLSGVTAATALLLFLLSLSRTLSDLIGQFMHMEVSY